MEESAQKGDPFSIFGGDRSVPPYSKVCALPGAQTKKGTEIISVPFCIHA
jgi:hypothetical protein